MSVAQKHYADNLSTSTEGMIKAPAAERNKEPILGALRSYLPSSGRVFEVASGPGQHVAHFAQAFPNVSWQPSDFEPSYLRSISAHTEHLGLKNVSQPIVVDITQPLESWANENTKPATFDLILNVNMIHISPWDTSLGLFKTAGVLLKSGGALFMYGPFKVHGILTPESNVRFDANLRSQDSRWGVRDTDDLEKLAKENNMQLERMIDLPSNNKALTFRKNKC